LSKDEVVATGYQRALLQAKKNLGVSALNHAQLQAGIDEANMIMLIAAAVFGDDAETLLSVLKVSFSYMSLILTEEIKKSIQRNIFRERYFDCCVS
jgi:hypothetical protein